MGVRVYLTGRIAVEAGGGVVFDQGGMRGRQARLAFAYLVTERARPVPTEELANVIWADEMPASWEVALSALVSRLRNLLSAEALKALGVSLSRSSGEYRLTLPFDAWVDLETGRSALDEGEGAVRSGQLSGVLGPATVAANIARRPFLPGLKAPWADAQRRKLQRQLGRALDCLSSMWLAEGHPYLAVETATEAVSLDPSREASYRLLMQAHVASGNRAEAIRVYHSLRRLLVDELALEPTPETDALYVKLLG